MPTHLPPGPASKLGMRQELAYIDKASTYERAAQQLAVSRRTFFRLLKRGVRDLTRALRDV